MVGLLSQVEILEDQARLAKKRKILVFPRTAGNTRNSRELQGFPGNYWEIPKHDIELA